MLVPSLDRFLAREVVVEVTKLTRPTRSSPSGPAVTFCPYNKSGAGWNTEPPETPDQFIRTFCGDQDPADVAQCVREKTFPLSSTIKHAVRDFRQQIPMMNSSLWRSQVATVNFGSCYTFIYPDTLEPGQAIFGFYL